MALTRDFKYSSETRIYIFRDKNILLTKEEKLPDPFIFNSLVESQAFTDFFMDTVTNSITGELKSIAEIPENLLFIAIREYFSKNDNFESSNAARMKSYIKWRENTQFCPSCGTKLEEFTKENARICPHCNKIHYPRIEPCIIVLIKKDDEILLVRHKNRNQDIFACIAGFIEAGESVENAVVREVKEEVGLEIKDLQYCGSQGWPFPDQLMLAFYAQYKSGEIKVQEEEIQEAKWFKLNELPACPKEGSVAWKLIFSLINNTNYFSN